VPGLVWACACLWTGELRATAVDETLAAAEQAHREGDYRRAAEELKSAAKFLAELGPEHRLRYWDLVADVTRDSQLFVPAEQAARRHLELLRQAASTGRGAPSDVERRSLVRLALVRRELAGGERRTAAGTRSLESARDLLTAALTMYSGRQSDLAWEAQTRLELARTLEPLGEAAEARREFAAASAAALRAIEQFDAESESTADWLFGLAIVQQAFGTGDRAAEAAQATLAIEPIERRLKGDLGVADRIKLRLAAASCYRQLRDAPAEQRQLAEAVRAAGDNPEVDQLELAGAMVRLAELAEVDVDTRQPGRVDALYGSAASLYGKALESARNKRASEDRLLRSIARQQEAECLLKLQLIHTRVENWSEAIVAADGLLKLRADSLIAGDPTRFRALAALGTLHARAARAARERSAGDVAKLSEARSHVAEAKRMLEAAAEFWRGYRPRSPDELAISLNYFAEVLRYDGYFQQANSLLDEALPDFESSMPDPADLRMAEFHSNRAAVLAALGQFSTAKESYDAAVTVCRQPDAEEARARRRLLAVVYLNLAQLYKSQRQYGEARRFCAQALDAADAAWLSQSDRVPFHLADSALEIAEAEQSWREFDAAGQWNDQARRDVRERLETAFAAAQGVLNVSDRDAMSQNAAMALHLEALARFLQARLCGGGDEAYREARELWLEIVNPALRQDAGGTAVFRVRALNYLAMTSLYDVMELRKTARRADNPADTQALMRASEEQLRSAQQWSEQADDLAERVAAYPAAQFQVLVTRAQVLEATARIARARERARIQSGAADIARQESAAADAATAQAIDKLYEALELVELPRGMTIGAEEERAIYFSQFAPAFDLLVDLLVGQERYVEAIEVSEQRRSRTFLDQLRASGVDIYATVADRELIAAEKKAADRYFAALARIQETGSDAALGDDLAQLQILKAERYEAHKRVVSASRAYRQLLVEPLRDRLANAERYQHDASDWVRERIGDDNLALVYYLGSANSYVFVCDPRSGVAMYPLTVSTDEARTLGLAFDGAPSLSPTGRSLRLEDVGALVSRVLFYIKPEIFRNERGGSLRVERSVKYRAEDVPAVTEVLLPQSVRERVASSSAGHLLIVPDGALHQLPFEALPLSTADSSEPAYLLDRLPPVVYAPSLKIYRQLVSEQRDLGGRTSLLSVADPDYRGLGGANRNAPVAAPVSFAAEFYALGGSLARLPGTRQESSTICRAFEQALGGDVDVIALTEDQATERNVRRELEENRFTFLHFAVHGLVDQRYQNLFGALAFTTPQRPTPADDGFLSLHEIVALPHGLDGCKLAVLSACETNCGPQSPLEAGSTMARAFLCAGAQRVVCSHWSVSDQETTLLVSRLMQGVAQDLANAGRVDYARELYEAKRALRTNPATASPQFWAPFVLIGPPTSGGDRNAELF
jgi:CHAT domain-containing protein